MMAVSEELTEYCRNLAALSTIKIFGFWIEADICCYLCGVEQDWLNVKNSSHAVAKLQNMSIMTLEGLFLP